MSTMEGELEILLGELHIKMKGANTHTHAHMLPSEPWAIYRLSVTHYLPDI